VLIAFFIGGVETLGLIGDRLGLSGWFWDAIAALNDNFNGLGFAIIGLFVVAWILSMVIYRYHGLDDIEAER
jgi:high-affinity nickel-transport protein